MEPADDANMSEDDVEVRQLHPCLTSTPMPATNPSSYCRVCGRGRGGTNTCDAVVVCHRCGVSDPTVHSFSILLTVIRFGHMPTHTQPHNHPTPTAALPFMLARTRQSTAEPTLVQQRSAHSVRCNVGTLWKDGAVVVGVGGGGGGGRLWLFGARLETHGAECIHAHSPLTITHALRSINRPNNPHARISSPTHTQPHTHAGTVGGCPICGGAQVTHEAPIAVQEVEASESGDHHNPDESLQNANQDQQQQPHEFAHPANVHAHHSVPPLPTSLAPEQPLQDEPRQQGPIRSLDIPFGPQLPPEFGPSARSGGPPALGGRSPAPTDDVTTVDDEALTPPVPEGHRPPAKQRESALVLSRSNSPFFTSLRPLFFHIVFSCCLASSSS
jgi:hypothetical protein